MYFTLNFIIAQLLVQVIRHESLITKFCDVGSTFFLSKDIQKLLCQLRTMALSYGRTFI